MPVIGDSRRFLYTMGKVINLCKRSLQRGLSSYISMPIIEHISFPCAIGLRKMHFLVPLSCRECISIPWTLVLPCLELPWVCTLIPIATLRRLPIFYSHLLGTNITCMVATNWRENENVFILFVRMRGRTLYVVTCVIMWPKKMKGKAMTIVWLQLVHTSWVIQLLFLAMTKSFSIVCIIWTII